MHPRGLRRPSAPVRDASQLSPGQAPLLQARPGRDKPEPEVDTVKIGVIAPITRSYETYIGKSVITSLGLKREDKEGRYRHQLNMGALFGAPCLIVATVPRDVLVEYAMLDVGLFLQTLALAAHDRGLGTCIMASSVHYADLLRRHGSIPEDRRIIMGAVIGYPETEAPINRFERQRAALTDFVKWVG